MLFNWVVAEGLCSYGMHDLARTARCQSPEWTLVSGFREVYDPRDGCGCGSTDLTWSAAPGIEVAAHA
jgi:hypothetical protein